MNRPKTLLACLALALAACRSAPSSSNAPATSAAPSAQEAVASKPPSAPLPASAPAASASSAPVVAGGPLHKRLIGTWAFDASPATRAKLVEQFKRSLHDAKEGEKMAKRFEEGLAHMAIEITPDTVITKENDAEVGKEHYDVVREDPDRITIRMAVSHKEQTLVFKDDRTVDLHDDQMGQVVLRRR